MGDSLRVSDRATAEVVRGVNEVDKVQLTGKFYFEHWRDGECIHREEVFNLITNEGKDKLLGVMFDSETQITSWYLGLISDTSFTAIAAGDTYAQIGGTNGWNEFTAYTDPANADSAVTRAAWTNDAPSAQSIANGTPVTVDITAGSSSVVKGLFLVGGATAQTKGDSTSGSFLWCATTFSGGDRSVVTPDQLKLVYAVAS